MVFTIKIKNAGKVQDVTLEDTDTGADFKLKIQHQTNIPTDKQKILIKGGKLNDDSVVKDLNLSQPVMVLGTPNNNINKVEIPKQVFLEDLNQNQLVKVSDEPSGLVNLGNTCYFNSSLQSLYRIDDIREGLKTANSTNSFVNSLKRLFDMMSKKQERINPTLFLASFRENFPQFSEQDNHGFYKQQDAEESFSQILNVLLESIHMKGKLTINLKTESKCLALPEEPVVTGQEDALKLMCHIDIKTNFLRDGLLNGLKETLIKHNDTLGSDAEYEITKTITKTPKYLIVHFVRFYWRRDTQKKSKILRKVQFPFELDISEMLDESIKPTKAKFRDDLRKIEKDNFEMVRDFKKAKKDDSLSPLQQQEEDQLKLESIKSKFEDDFNSLLKEHNIDEQLDSLTENPSSVYKLSSIITHAGSSADSGHYQSFAKDEGDLEDEHWWKFNDEKISRVSRDKIEQLSGGGESDSALLLIYKASGL
ncbi:deubiquitinating enzyme [Yamadazyma tenuis]|uniref:Ubiquitin carboxyl-terminal hydrolase n=1 Tax=Candida tenuis (strain ATCC 10573 / BCRC 21748 / CBS 615 / JCM 9827 / NBRC 10315 / NRRL Y-1498 / VKM Y-70) TaxID=590646 RepID=G3AZ76_CANTC|nr:deubiquitinating enzyme [Yamadazyma tenuis ATCC 10573]EGV66026.1 deubiquitinating enzyme [Yamadazyma tenuis ATCC 10573]WEJ95633.1 deubiquitinating enzyme [Yamadazyma tenuis]